MSNPVQAEQGVSALMLVICAKVKIKITVQNTHDEIIPQDLFEHVQAIINPNNSHIKPKIVTNNTNENQLRGQVICGSCGGRMQRRKGIGNAGWNFFTCISNIRHGKGSCD